ncbi:MAG: DUF6580 family putative transport protein [Verrucomicrobiota bacterium]
MSTDRTPVLAFAVLLGSLALFRLAGASFPLEWVNFSPFAACLLLGGRFLPGRASLTWLLAVFFVTGLALNLAYGGPLFAWSGLVALLALALAWLIGRALQKRQAGFLLTLGGSLGAALLFYLLTNAFSWLGSDLYPKNLTGLQEAFWTGPPEAVLPTWWFFRNSLIGNVLFTTVYWWGVVHSPGKARVAKLAREATASRQPSP